MVRIGRGGAFLGREGGREGGKGDVGVEDCCLSLMCFGDVLLILEREV